MYANQPIRHPMNTKLRLHYDISYNKYDVQQHNSAPLITQYLERTEQVFFNALNQYNRVLAFRIDLRFPEWMPSYVAQQDNHVINAFLKRLQRSLDQAETKYRSIVRFTWAREQDQSDKPHYHVLLLINYDMYNSLGALFSSHSGSYEGKGLYHQIVRAWGHAMGVESVQCKGLVNVTEDYNTKKPWIACLSRFDQQGLSDAFYRASYLCKAYSKHYGQKFHCFGSSRQ